MPVNKLWIEYTERAAWESVEALRRKLAEAEARIERMAPSNSGWRELFDALDAAQQQQALDGATYADLVQGILDRLADVQARAAVMTEELARIKSLGLPAMAASPAPALAWYQDPEAPYLEDAEASESETEHFVRAVEHRCRSLASEPGSTDLDGVLRAIEARVDSLSDMDDPGIAEAAVELAALAACLAAVARRNARLDRSI
jgi:hypothetical protein